MSNTDKLIGYVLKNNTGDLYRAYAEEPWVGKFGTIRFEFYTPASEKPSHIKTPYAVVIYSPTGQELVFTNNQDLDFYLGPDNHLKLKHKI